MISSYFRALPVFLLVVSSLIVSAAQAQNLDKTKNTGGTNRGVADNDTQTVWENDESRIRKRDGTWLSVEGVVTHINGGHTLGLYRTPASHDVWLIFDPGFRRSATADRRNYFDDRYGILVGYLPLDSFLDCAGDEQTCASISKERFVLALDASSVRQLHGKSRMTLNPTVPASEEPKSLHVTLKQAKPFLDAVVDKSGSSLGALGERIERNNRAYRKANDGNGPPSLWGN